MRPAAAAIIFAFLVGLLSFWFSVQHFTLSVVAPEAPPTALLTGQARLPYQYRTLVPTMVEFLAPAIPTAAADWLIENLPAALAERATSWRIGSERLLLFFLFEFSTLFLLGYVVAALAQLMGMSLAAARAAALLMFYPLCFQYLYAPEPRFWYPSDLPAVLFLVGGLYSVYLKRIRLLVLVFLLGTFNRETTLLLLPALWLYFSTDPRRWRLVGGLMVGWLLIKALLLWAYRENGGIPFHPNLLFNLSYLGDGSNLKSLAMNFGGLWVPALLALLGWPRAAVRGLLLTVFSLLLVMIVVGYLPERRIFAEAAPLIALLALQGIGLLRVRLAAYRWGMAGLPVRSLLRRTIAWGSYPILFLALLGTHAVLAEYCFDDAYIHFRLAENFLNTGAPYYNPGEAVLASSSLGYLLLMTLAFAVFGTGLTGPVLLNALTLTLCAYVYGRLPESLSGRRSLWLSGAGGLLVTALLLRSSVGLMETAVALGLLGWAGQRYLKGGSSAFILLAVAVFVRLEMLVFLLCFGLHAVYRQPGSWLMVVRGVFLGSGLFLLLSLSYFGTIIPNTVVAKSLVYTLSPAESLFRLLKSMALSLDGLLLVLLSLMAVPLILAAARKRPAGLGADNVIPGLFFSGAIGVAAAYTAAGTFIFAWYTPLVLVPAAYAVFLWVCRSSSRWAKGLALLSLVPHLLIPFLIIYAAATGRVEWHPDFREGARVRKYVEVGERLRGLFPTARLMTSEIGALGFAFKGYILDGVGLVSPAALSFHPLAIPAERSKELGAIPLGFIEQEQPELIVSLPEFIEAFRDSAARRYYELTVEGVFREDDAARVAVPQVWGSEELYVFRLEREH